jgi:hypothetical protein
MKISFDLDDLLIAGTKQFEKNQKVYYKEYLKLNCYGLVQPSCLNSSNQKDIRFIYIRLL